MSKVKVFNKITGSEQFINRVILNSPAGRNFEFISDGHPDDSDIYDPDKEYPVAKSPKDTDQLLKEKSQEIENLKQQLAKAQSAAPASESTDEPAPERKKPGPKPKNISSLATASEV